MKSDYFHGGAPNLSVGSYLLPGAATGQSNDPDVYITTDWGEALLVAVAIEGAIYRVKPIGRITRNGGENGCDLVCRKALIIGRSNLSPPLLAALKADPDGFHRMFYSLWWDNIPIAGPIGSITGNRAPLETH